MSELRAWRGLAAFAALEPSWERLRQDGELDPLCNSHHWTREYARAFVPDQDAFGWSLERGGECLGIVALRREPSRGKLALRRALFLGDGSFDSDYLEPPIHPGFEREVARLLIDAAGAVRGLEALVFSGLPAGSRFLAELRAELEVRALPRRERDVPCLAAALPASLEGYLAQLKPRMRTKVRAALRSAGERGARIAWCERTEDLEPYLADLQRLHELRWRALGKPGAFEDDRRRAFLRSIASAALGEGRLRLARLEQEGVALAVQLGLLAGGRYYQVQEGFDPEHEEARVGVALRALAIEALIKEGVRAYDFMAGDSRHKRDWDAGPRPCTTVAFPLPGGRAPLVYRLKGALERWRR